MRTRQPLLKVCGTLIYVNLIFPMGLRPVFRLWPSPLFYEDLRSHAFSILLTTGPTLLPKRFLRIVRSRASSFKWEYPFLSLRSHTDTPHSAEILWPSDHHDQRPQPDNTQHSLNTDIHAHGGIRTRDTRKWVTADPHLRPCDHWDRPLHIFSSLLTYSLRVAESFLRRWQVFS
jgi:hypothetical protein